MKRMKVVFSMVLVIIMICTSVNLAFAADKVTISSLAENVTVPAGSKVTITASQDDAVMQKWTDGAWEEVADWAGTNMVEVNNGENYFKAVTESSESNVITVTGTNFEKVAERYNDADKVNYTASSTSASSKGFAFAGAALTDGIVVVEATVNMKDELGTWQLYPECTNGSYFGLFSFVTNKVTEEDVAIGNIEDLNGKKYGEWVAGEDAKIVWIADYSTSKVYSYVNGVLARIWDRSNAGLGTSHYWNKLKMERKVSAAGITSSADIKINAYTAKIASPSAVITAEDAEMLAGYPHKLNLNVSNVEDGFDVEVYNGAEKVSGLSAQIAGTISVPYTPSEGANDVKVKIIKDGVKVAESNALSFVTTKKATFYANEEYNYDTYDAAKLLENGWTASANGSIVDSGNDKYGKVLSFASGRQVLTHATDFGAGQTVVIENSYCFESLPVGSDYYFFQFRHTGASESYTLCVNKSGAVCMAWVGTGKTIKAGEWHDIKAVYTIGEENMTYSYYLDGELLSVNKNGVQTSEITLPRTTLNKVEMFVNDSNGIKAKVDNSRVYTIDNITFKNEVAKYDLGNIEAKPYEDTESSKVVCATINTDGSKADAMLICAVYSFENELKTVVTQPVAIAEGEYSKKVYNTISAIAPGDTVRAMVWNSIDGMVPFDKAEDIICPAAN